jgi:molecular chaperone GrpE (heat shock protein)
VALTMGETELLGVLDQLDRAAGMADLPALARDLLEGAKNVLLSAAEWQPIAVTGATPEDVGIRIAESIGESVTNGHADVRIHRILEQGYRRADGTLLRPGIVIAAAAPSNFSSTVSSRSPDENNSLGN